MTTQRELKRLIRERAARTGESYTTARRHVLAHAGRSGPSPVPGYPRFGGGLHHESTLLAHLLEQAGHVAPHTGRPYTETTLCGLAGGIGFLYAVFEYRGLPAPLVTVVAQHHPQPWLPAALDRLGIGYRTEHGRAAVALRTVDQPMHCLVSRADLPWNSDVTALAADPYPVVVVARDGGDLLVDDEAPEPRRVPEETFRSAWSAYRKGRNQRILIDPPAGAPDLATAMRAAVTTTARHLTGPVLGNAFDVNMGLSGMARLAAQLRDRRGRSGWTRRFAALGALPFAALRLYECLELRYTAPAATRPLYAGYLDEAATVLGDVRLTEAAVEFRRSGARWAELAEHALAVAGEAGRRIEERLFQQMTGAGPDPEPESGEVPPADHDEFLVAAADLVDEALAAETRAAALLLP
ncbi:DUF4872 domain-containing protein [Actinoplanes sp. NPDC049265]|uniref:DUF4872 domain-containing protein n=1 Tax=Actinoplanes sp. NPDC049265 TaxID=3363902 RepID=UPI00372355BF